MRRLNQLNSTINTSPFAELATKTVEDSTLDVIIITVKPRLTTTSLLRPLFFGRLAKTAIYFLVKKTLVNTAKFFWPIGHRVNGVSLYN